jgi:hypothetical protein
MRLYIYRFRATELVVGAESELAALFKTRLLAL